MVSIIGEKLNLNIQYQCSVKGRMLHDWHCDNTIDAEKYILVNQIMTIFGVFLSLELMQGNGFGGYLGIAS